MRTIADVAAHAGVSKATASRALSGRGYVSEETAARVRAAAEALAYVAHSGATSMATGRTQTVGVLTPSIDRWYFAELLEGVQESLLAREYDLVLYGLKERPAARDRMIGHLLTRRQVDGIIAAGLAPGSGEQHRLQRLDLPLVAVGPALDSVPGVGTDDGAAARIATEHLLQLGHHDIAFVGGSSCEQTSLGDARRFEGYRDAMIAAGHAEAVRHASGEPTMPGGYAAAASLLGDQRHRPTGLVGVCDEAAIGAVIAARRLGIVVPTDLSVIGIDDHAHAEMFALTTIHQAPRTQGHRAVDLLFERMRAPDAAIRRVIDVPSLVVRSSTTRLAGT